MPRSKAVDELAYMMNVLSHPDRIRLVEELRAGEKDVNQLAERLELAQARVSQHLALLRQSHIVVKRKEGRRAFYSLSEPKIAGWITNGLDFIEAELRRVDSVHDEVEELRERWGRYG